MVCDFTYLNDI